MASEMPPQDRSREIITVSIAMTVTVCVIVPLRFFVRGKMVGKLGADDWCIGVATILSIVMNCYVLLSIKHGAGKHVVDISPEDFLEGMRLNYVTQCLTVPCLAMVKLSIGLFLLRLAATKSYRHLCVGFLVFMGTYSLGSTFTIIFQCFPVEKVWNYSAGGKCMPIKSRVALGYSYSIITIISDFFLVLVPIPMLWHVKIPRRQRAAVCGVLSIGTFAASASIVKCLYLVNYGKTGDFLWDSVDLSTWSILEINIGILSSSIPSLKPLFKKILDKTLSSSSFGNTGGSYDLQLSSIRSGAVTNDIRAGDRKSKVHENGSEEQIFGINRSVDVRVDVESLSQCSVGKTTPKTSFDMGPRESKTAIPITRASGS